MTGRSVQEIQKYIDITNSYPIERRPKAQRRRRRILAPFLTGFGLLSLGFCSLGVGVAANIIDRSEGPISFIMSQVHNRFEEQNFAARPARVLVLSSLTSTPRPKSKGVIALKASESLTSLPRRSVCVRLCDGYFFPVGPLSQASDLPDHEAACTGLCPDAPTQLFVQPAGSDNIADAVSSNGAHYSALPVAFRNRTAADRICACHRGGAQSFSLREDFTLRKGDSIMTPSGIIVFRGAGRAPFAPNDFTVLAKASLPRDKRATLAAIERAALPNLRQATVGPLEPRKSLLAFNPPLPAPLTPASLDRSFHFVELRTSATN
jgi:Protein of unknown function (DUF2865)